MVVGPKTIDKYAGKTISNTFCSFSKVVGNKYRIAKTRRASDVSVSPESNPWKNPERHVMRLGKIYSDSLMDTIHSKFKTALQDKSNVYEREIEGDVYARQLCPHDPETNFDIATHVPEVRQLINDKISTLLTQYYDAHFKPDFIKMYRNEHIPDNIHERTGVYSDRWHMDSYAVDGIRLFINLDNISEDHGPLHIISRNDTKRLVNGSFDRSEEGIPGGVVKKHADVMKATGEAGTATFANPCTVLHRASNPAEGKHRDFMMISFLCSDEPLSDDWITDYPLDKCKSDAV